ncbi:DUF6538 domain-containing protein [Azospirillum brasilense]|uniref:DUF6538 domain-containing protein n=1 Tax=Azospirillum brasilense TaxID=192 RepID=UPI003D7C7F0D
MLTRQGATYHFRRRVPVAIRLLLRQSEVWVSLRTTDRRPARATAAGLYALTEDARPWPRSLPNKTRPPLRASLGMRVCLFSVWKRETGNVDEGSSSEAGGAGPAVTTVSDGPDGHGVDPDRTMATAPGQAGPAARRRSA